MIDYNTFISRCDDGHPRRVVYLDGKEISQVQIADPVSGVIVRACDPLRIIDGEIETETLHGDVRVFLLDKK